MLINLVETEMHREQEMNEMRKVIVDQLLMKKSLLKDMLEIKKVMNMSTLMTEKEIDEIMDICQYATISEKPSGAGGVHLIRY